MTEAPATARPAVGLRRRHPLPLDRLLDGVVPGRRCVAAAVDEWRVCSRREVPDAAWARAEFAATLGSDYDLGPEQVAELLDTLVPPGAFDLGTWLADGGHRLLTRLRPWFPLWWGFSRWTVEWAAARRYPVVAFLCRDSLPFYVLARELANWRPGVPRLALLHASRCTVASGALARHVHDALGDEGRVVFVDSGCYGSLLPRLLDVCPSASGRSRPAVLFFFSRNPLVFGYMNYLAAAGHLCSCKATPEGRTELDFAIYAGDVLESVPKGYRIVGLDPAGRPVLEPQDLVSYVFARVVLRELVRFGRRAARLHREADSPRDAASELFARFAAAAGGGECDGGALLLRAPAPKSVPAGLERNRAYRAAFPPQDEFFGVMSA